jgi:diaminopimelate epimerase
VHFNTEGDRYTDVFLEGDARVIYRGELWEEAWLS